MKTQQVNSRLSRDSMLTMRAGSVYQQLGSLMLLLIAGISIASAGSFQVNPVRATLSPSKPISSMTVRNTGTAPAVLQLEVMTWSQQQGKDVYAPSQEVLATPPIFTIPAGGSQVIRVGLRRAPDTQRELTYRLFLQEVPPPPISGFQGLQVALRIGVPVFVEPATKQPLALIWKVYRRNGQLEVGLTNNGNTHIQVANFSLADANGSKLGIQHIAAYVLPSQSASWQVKGINVPSSASSLHLFAQTDGGEIDAGTVTVESK